MKEPSQDFIEKVAPMLPMQAAKYISRDLSWLKFNERVLHQAVDEGKPILERLRFLAISASNLDEFCMVRLGSLYNYIDYKRKRLDNFGLREVPFKHKLLTEAKNFVKTQQSLYIDILQPLLKQGGIHIVKNLHQLHILDQVALKQYFNKALFPMLTPMVFDSYHAFPTLMNKVLVFGVVTQDSSNEKHGKKLSFIQIPQNLPRFYEIQQGAYMLFVPVEEIIKHYLHLLFKNIKIISATLFRLTRNGDVSIEESDDIEANFLEELKGKLKRRKYGRVVRIEIEQVYDRWMLKLLKYRWNINQDNVFTIPQESLLDLTGLYQIIDHHEFKDQRSRQLMPVLPLGCPAEGPNNIFELLKQQDVLLHHPYNDIDWVINLLEKAAEDPDVLAIKMTIYRLAPDSAVTAALLRAVENGKHVSVLFELKARFDEENNIKEAKKLEKAGCFVIYGMSHVKTHAKVLMIVRSVEQQITCYVHLSSGNYNEETAKHYVDLSLLTTDRVYVHDVADFFNVITGHSLPSSYENLITAPLSIRGQLVDLIRQEAANARSGLPAGIVIKVNSLEDEIIIDELYHASQAGVSIRLIVRGICCLIPGKLGMSENITVCSIIGNFLEHTRIYYFHHQANPKVYVGSIDIMVRSFDRRIEALFMITDPMLKQQIISILVYNFRDNVNSYLMQSNGIYVKKAVANEPVFNLHEELFKIDMEVVSKAKLFS